MTIKYIFTVDEVKKIFSEKVIELSDENIKFLILQAQFEIERIIKRWLNEKEITENIYVKTAAKNFLQKYIEAENPINPLWKMNGISSFRQWNISVNFESSESKKAVFDTEMRKILLPLMKVKVWS